MRSIKDFFDYLFGYRQVERYVRVVVRLRFLILIFSVIITAGALLIAKDIRVNCSLMALLPANTPSVQRIKALEKKTGGFGDLIVMIESPDKKENISAAESLVQQIRTFPWVGRAEYRLDDSLFFNKKLLFLQTSDLKEIHNRILRQIRKKQNPLFVDLLEEEEQGLDFRDIEKKYEKRSGYRKINVNKDSTMLLIVVHPAGITSNISFSRSVYNDVKKVVTAFEKTYDKGNMQISVGGTYRNRLDEYETILHDVTSSSILGGLFIVLLLFLFFRQIRHLVTLLVPLLMSLSWTFALTVLFIGELNLITAFLIIILFGLGIDFGIHFLSRYSTFRKSNLSHFEALIRVLQMSGRASLIAATTTIAAFYMLTFSNFLGFRHFGFIAGTGVFLSFVAYITLFPALVTVWNDLTKDFCCTRKDQSTSDASINGAQPISRQSAKTGRIVLILSGCVTIFCGWKMFNVSFEYDFRNLRSQISSTREFNRKMREVFAEARDPAAVLVSNSTDIDAILEYLDKNHLSGPDSPIDDVKSLRNVMPQDQKEKLEIISEIKKLLVQYLPSMSIEQRSVIEKMMPLLVDDSLRIDDIPASFRKTFFGQPGTEGQLMYLFQRKSLLDIHAAKEFAQAVGTMKIHDKSYYAISEPLVYVDLLNLLERDSLISIICAFVLIFLLIYIDIGSFKSTIIIITPLITGIVWMMGLMGALNIKLNIFNMVILPSILGLSVDSAVHIFHRFEESDSVSIKTVLFETGSASLFCTLTTLVGFGSLLFAKHPGLKSMGELAILGMVASLAASLSVLPAILVITKRRSVA
jgi:predicted RND superfamily exporter protein